MRQDMTKVVRGGSHFGGHGRPCTEGAGRFTARAAPWMERGVRCGLLLSALVLCLAACNRAPDAASDRPAAAADAGPADDVAGAAASSGADATAVFDAAALPVSSAPLGSFPYLGLPRGYATREVIQSGFDRVPFWTGDRIEWVEGTIYAAAVHSDGGHSYSQAELGSALNRLVESLGGTRIFSGAMPAAAASEIGNSKAAVTYVGGLGDIYNEPAETFVIHRADRDIWVHLGAGGMLVAETRPVEVTAAVPAEPQRLADAEP